MGNRTGGHRAACGGEGPCAAVQASRDGTDSRPALVRGDPAGRKFFLVVRMLGQQGPEYPGQHVTASGSGHPRRGFSLAEDRAVRRGHQRGGALEQDGGPGPFSRLAHGVEGGTVNSLPPQVDPVALQDMRQLAAVRCQHHVRRKGIGKGRQRTGVGGHWQSRLHGVAHPLQLFVVAVGDP